MSLSLNDPLRHHQPDGSTRFRSQRLRTASVSDHSGLLRLRSNTQIHRERSSRFDWEGRHRYRREHRYREGNVQGTPVSSRRFQSRRAYGCVDTNQALLQKNAKVYLASRNEARGKAAIAELLEETGREAVWLQLDLSSFQSIEAAAAEFHGSVCFPSCDIFSATVLIPASGP
jgi:hypothetical protein